MVDDEERIDSRAPWTDFERPFEKVATTKKPRRRKTDTPRKVPSSKHDSWVAEPSSSHNEKRSRDPERRRRKEGASRNSSLPPEQQQTTTRKKNPPPKLHIDKHHHKENRLVKDPAYIGVPRSPAARSIGTSSANFADLPLQISTKVHKYEGHQQPSSTRTSSRRRESSSTRRRTSESRDDQSEGAVPREDRGRASSLNRERRTRDKSTSRQSVASMGNPPTSNRDDRGRSSSRTKSKKSSSESKRGRSLSQPRVSINATSGPTANNKGGSRSRHPPLTKENFKTHHSRARSASLSRVSNLAEYESPTKASSRSRRPPSTFRTRQELPVNRSRAVSEGDSNMSVRSQHSRSNTDPNIGSYISFDSSETSGGMSIRLMKKGNGFIEKLFGNPVNRPTHNTLAGSLGNEIRPRILLAATVYHNTATNLWITTINTNQRGVAKNPATANKFLKAFSFPTEREARESAIANAPPKMVPFNESPVCFCCKGKFAVFRRASHCRNCGVCACSNCSTTWPSRMLPATYNLKREAQVRVCVSCNALSASFKKALLDGDLEEAVALYGTGNVNLRTPFPIGNKKDEVMYPIHCAVEGGNLGILRWLIDDHFCPVKIHRSPGANKKVKRTPHDSMISTSRGRTALSISLENLKVDILRYLVVDCGVSIYEAKDLKSSLRALEASLYAIPSNSQTICDRPSTPHSTRWDHASFDDFSEPSSLGADEHFGGDESLVSQSNRSVRSQANSRGGDACIICFDRKINCVATPCGHQVCCLTCSTNLASCPVCNDKTSFIKIFRP